MTAEVSFRMRLGREIPQTVSLWLFLFRQRRALWRGEPVRPGSRFLRLARRFRAIITLQNGGEKAQRSPAIRQCMAPFKGDGIPLIANLPKVAVVGPFQLQRALLRAGMVQQYRLPVGLQNRRFSQTQTGLESRPPAQRTFHRVPEPFLSHRLIQTDEEIRNIFNRRSKSQNVVLVQRAER